MQASLRHSLHSGASAGWSWREVTAREGKWTKKTVTKRAISKGSAVQCYGHHLIISIMILLTMQQRGRDTLLNRGPFCITDAFNIASVPENH